MFVVWFFVCLILMFVVVLLMIMIDDFVFDLMFY